jgi:UDP-N-acetylglucosamine--N-acetylmuramyl-(pentapeptide) pyrophosphoryl-undecaprenol N-acetylglucosamine transferase
MINFFASPIGLGHATRDVAIAKKLGGDILFVSGDAAAGFISKKGYKVLDVYRPEKFVVKSGRLQQSFKWLMGYYSYYKKCKEVSQGILKEHAGLIVSDEDFASIAIGEEMKRKRVLITDITETHFTNGPASLIEKKMNKSMQKMMQACDCVIIPDVGDDRDNVVHVGPIVRQASADRETLRRRFELTKKTIAVSIGGTDAGRYLIEKTIEAHRKLKLDSELVIVSGPSVKLPDSPDYRNLGFVENLHELIYAADLIVSLAGRSTMDESIAYGTPGIFIPIKGHFEQEQGAARLGYKYDDVFRLDSLIEEKLGSRNDMADAGGAERAAKIISSLLHEIKR